MNTRLRTAATLAGLGRIVGPTIIWMVSCCGTAAADDVVVVPFESEWRMLSPIGFLDDPGYADPSFDTNWFTPAFDDSAWEGPRTAPFGYGGVPGLVRLDPYPLLDPGDGDRYANYFRHEFTTADPLSDLVVEFLADDGAVFYLDGEMILQHNCCVDQFDGRVEDDFLHFANRLGNDLSFLTRRVLRGQELPAGDHVLAVSVHQFATNSQDLGLEMRLISRDTDEIVIDTGIDTTLAEAGLNGPDQPHGAVGQNPDGFERWEWDGADAGGENHGLLWFDIPQEVLDGFNYGTATLRLHVDNGGDPGDLYRMTVDWLSGPGGGDQVTWNSVPNGPGIVPGRNAQSTPNAFTEDLFGLDAQIIDVDVTADVVAWSLGEPNYGWGFLPSGPDGVGITSFESVFDPIPELIVLPGDGGPFLEAGDANEDVEFDQFDLVRVLAAGKYLTGEPATWGEGDWDGAPGGKPGSPPAGDGVFNQLDLIVALGKGLYRTGPYAAVAPNGRTHDGQTSMGYDAKTGTILDDLTVVGSLAGGGGLGEVDRISIPVPEPSTVLMLLVGGFCGCGVVLARRRGNTCHDRRGVTLV